MAFLRGKSDSSARECLAARHLCASRLGAFSGYACRYNSLLKRSLWCVVGGSRTASRSPSRIPQSDRLNMALATRPQSARAAMPSDGPSAWVAVGTRLPSTPFSAMKGRGFSAFTYEPSEREALPPKLTYSGGRKARPQSAAAEKPIFMCRALPMAPRQAGAFQRFRYSVNPFEAFQDITFQEEQRQRSLIRAGSFRPGGKGKRADSFRLKLRAPELKADLQARLKKDWPSFIAIRTDERGIILACFAAERLDHERRRDLRTYMNRLLTTHPACTEYCLMKEPTRWGVVLDDDPDPPQQQLLYVEPPRLLYAFRPPWVDNDPHGLLTKPAAKTERRLVVRPG